MREHPGGGAADLSQSLETGRGLRSPLILSSLAGFGILLWNLVNLEVETGTLA